MRIAITGANGFIGSELAGYFLGKGHEVLLLQRRPPAILPRCARYINYDMNKAAVPELSGVDALVHTAYMPYTPSNNSSEINTRATRALFEECKRVGAQFVFLSSMSAHQNALSEYGKHKFRIEQLLDKNQCLILKLGLVLGKEGLFSRINRSVKNSPFVFMIGGGEQPVQPVYIIDVCTVVEKCITNNIKGIYCIALPQVYTMKELFAAIAAATGRKTLFIPVPYGLAGLALNVIEMLRLPFPVSHENLKGLKQLQSADTVADLKRLDIQLTDLHSALQLLK